MEDNSSLAQEREDHGVKRGTNGRNGWRPITEAPRDGSSVVIWLDDEGFWVVARYTADEDGGAWFIPSMDEYAGGDDCFHSVTWWLPVVAPAEDARESTERGEANTSPDSNPQEVGLVKALEKARDQFEFYATEHRKKALAQRFNGLKEAERIAWEKCQTNEQFADMCRAALSHRKTGVKT
jgi:hypothetical protein